jgi:hypothetical protein
MRIIEKVRILLKFVVPFLFLSTAAFAAVPKQPTPTQPKIPTITRTMECNDKSVGMTIKSLAEIGYEPLIGALDSQDETLLHEILYNFHNNSIASVSIYFSDKNKKEAVKICVESVMVQPYGDGPTFKNFVLHQHIDELESMMKEKNTKDKED